MENLQLTAAERNILESIYGRQLQGNAGYNPRQFEAIKPLTADEQKFFTDKNFVSPHFFVQTLYKIRGNLSPINFNRTVFRMINDTENLRANFCNVGSRAVKIIQFAKIVKPEIIFRNLTQIDPDDLDNEFRKILEADMRRDCDIRHDPLIRFAVYRTSDDEFAALVTIAQLVADSFHADKFFAEVLDQPFESAQEKSSGGLPPKDQSAIRDYWANVLDKAPPPVILPFERPGSGVYRQKAHRTHLPADILSDLRWRAQSNRMLLTAILQSAWGFMLQLENKRRDCIFCQILSGENSALNVIPVRVQTLGDLTVEKIVRKQFRQLVVSQPYSCVDWSDLQSLLGRGKKLFDHFLSFKEFQSGELNYVDTPADERGKIISRNSWDAQGMTLGAYFRYSEKDLSITFLYDETKFLRGGVERLCDLYTTVIQQMLVDWNANFTDFLARLGSRVTLLEEHEQVSREDERKQLRDFLSQLPILQGRFAGTIGLFDDVAKLVTRYEGDRISGDMLKEHFIFVVEGKLARNVDTGDGWFNPIDIVGKNGFVNPTSILERQRLTLSAEVLTEQARLLTIPHETLIELLRKTPELSLSMMIFSLEQMERWQALWLQS